MFEFVNLFKTFMVIEIKIYDINLVIHRISVKRGDSHLKLAILPSSKCNSIVLKVAFVSIDLIHHLVFCHVVNLVFQLRLAAYLLGHLL